MKKRHIHILKALAACVLFCAPCALYFLMLPHKLPGGVLLYSYSGALWVLTPLAGLSAAVALKGREKPSDGQDCIEEDCDMYEEQEIPSENEVGETYIEEYSELYRNVENEAREEYIMPDIETAISAQKASPVSDDENSVEADGQDSIWSGFFADKENDAASEDPVYNNIPDTLPEGFSFIEDSDDGESYENDDVPEEDEAFSEPRLPLMRIAAAAVCAAAIIASVPVSSVYTADTEKGISVGNIGGAQNYSWENVETVEVSPAALGDGIRIRARMNDGKRITLCSDSMIRGSAADKDASDAELYSDICAMAQNGGAKINVTDRKALEASFEDSEDWIFISRILGEAE